MTANTLEFIRTAEPVHDYAKREIAPIVNGNWSFFGGFLELFEGEQKLVDRMTKQTEFITQLAFKLQENFTDIEIYSYNLYLEMLIREHKIYRERMGWFLAYLIAPFIIGFAFLVDQRGAVLLMTLLTVIPAILIFSYRFGKIYNFTRTLKLACEFFEINEKHSGK